MYRDGYIKQGNILLWFLVVQSNLGIAKLLDDSYATFWLPSLTKSAHIPTFFLLRDQIAIIRHVSRFSCEDGEFLKSNFPIIKK